MNPLHDPVFSKVVKNLKESKLADDYLIFGSSVNSTNFQDIDTLFHSDKRWTPKRFISLVDLMFKLEKKYPNVSFSFQSGSIRDKNKKIKISIVPSSRYAKDEILEYAISKNNRLLFGKNPYEKYRKPKINFFLTILLRQKESKQGLYKIIKQYIFIGLLWKGIVENKERILQRFNKEYKTNIFKKYQDINEFVRHNEKNIKSIFEELEQVILKDIKKQHPNYTNKRYAIRSWTKYEKFIFEVGANLRRMYEKNSFGEIKKYLLEKQEIYEKEF